MARGQPAVTIVTGTNLAQGGADDRRCGGISGFPVEMEYTLLLTRKLGGTHTASYQGQVAQCTLKSRMLRISLFDCVSAKLLAKGRQELSAKGLRLPGTEPGFERQGDGRHRYPQLNGLGNRPASFT